MFLVCKFKSIKIKVWNSFTEKYSYLKFNVKNEYTINKQAMALIMVWLETVK